jgi:hypothetical protein
MTSIRYRLVDNSITAMIRRLEDFGKENLPKESGVCEGQDGYQPHTSIALQVNKISIHTAHPLYLFLVCMPRPSNLVLQEGDVLRLFMPSDIL